MKKTSDKILAILSLFIMIACFALGNMRNQSLIGGQIESIVPNYESYSELDTDLYQVNTKDGNHLYMATATHPGYAGAMNMGIIVDPIGTILQVAILSTPDTAPYIAQVLDAKIPDAYLDNKIDSLPNPDAVSGATLSSDAIKLGIEKASIKLMTSEAVKNGVDGVKADFAISPESLDKAKVVFAEVNATKLSTTEIIKIVIVLLFFAVTIFISSKRYTFNKKYTRYALLLSSVVLLGFMYGTQFSLSTIVVFVSGAWLAGLASYAPLICLVLAVVCLIITKKNYYCMFICPFGALQEGVSLITSCKNPVHSPVIKWVSRFFALALICFALYFSSPSVATYEPFGKTFNFVGPLLLFMLSSSVIILSLFINKPWCRLFCPMTPLFDYIYFWRSWLIPSKNQSK